VKIGEAETVAVPTRGKPDVALATVASRRWSKAGRVYNVSVAHDDSCPCGGGGRSMSYCTCEIVEVSARRVA